MPLLSCFTTFGQLEFSSRPPAAKLIYDSLIASYRDPKTGAMTMNTTPGTHLEAKLYGWSMALGTSQAIISQLGRETRPETSYALLEAHERAFLATPGPNDTVIDRRNTLQILQAASLGSLFHVMVETLTTMLGADFLGYRPVMLEEMAAYPNINASPGTFGPPSLVAKSVRLLGPVTRKTEARICATNPLDFYVADSDHVVSLDYGHPVGQVFVGDGNVLDRGTFWLGRFEGASGEATAYVYDVDATLLPIGNPLAISAAVDVSAVDASDGDWLVDRIRFNFQDADRILLRAGVRYALVVDVEATSASELGYFVATDGGSGGYLTGALLFNDGTAWRAQGIFNTIFEVRTDYVQTVAYESWNRRAAGQQLVRGDVLCVNPDDWGLAERVEVLEGSVDEGQQLFTAAFARPHSAGVMATTAPVPLLLSTKRHVLILVTSRVARDPVRRAKVDAFLHRIMRAPTTWDIIETNDDDGATFGPFKLGVSALGCVPVHAAPVLDVWDGTDMDVTPDSDCLLTESGEDIMTEGTDGCIQEE